MVYKVIQWERMKVKQVILFIIAGIVFIIAPIITLLFKPGLRSEFNYILFVIAFIYCGIQYIVAPIWAYKPYKMVFTNNTLEIHYVNLANRYKVRVVRYDEIDVVYYTYRRSPRKDKVLVRLSENKEMLAGLLSKAICEKLIDEFSRHPDAKIIRVEMK